MYFKGSYSNSSRTQKWKTLNSRRVYWSGRYGIHKRIGQGKKDNKTAILRHFFFWDLNKNLLVGKRLLFIIQKLTVLLGKRKGNLSKIDKEVSKELLPEGWLEDMFTNMRAINSGSLQLLKWI